MFYIKRKNVDNRQACYVAPSGHENSYVKDITKARQYATRKEAESNCCKENECVVEF